MADITRRRARAVLLREHKEWADVYINYRRVNDAPGMAQALGGMSACSLVSEALGLGQISPDSRVTGAKETSNVR